MKTIILAFALAIIISVSSFAQIARMTIKSKEADIPVTVVESFKKDFKDATASEWALVPPQFAGHEYVVSGYNHLEGVQPASYTVIMRGPEVNGQALYNKSGELVYLKEHIDNTALPPAVTNAVLAKYPGYGIVKDQEIIMQGKTTVIHYKVTIHKGNEDRVLAANQDGQILRERKR